MNVIILPGYSPSNKQWAYQVKEYLEQVDEKSEVKGVYYQSVSVHEWKHWQGGSFGYVKESELLDKKITTDSISIIAKSIGTRVLMKKLPSIINRLDKVILCGIPTKFENDNDIELYKKGFEMLGSKKLLIVQNTNDPLSSFDVVEKFVSVINGNIQVISKEASNHDYPYFEDFARFLRTSE